MRTVVFPPAGAHGFGRSRTVGVVAHPLTDPETRVVVDALAEHGIPLAVRPGQTVHLYAVAPLTTAQGVRALAAFLAVTDSRLAFHPALAGRSTQEIQ